MKTFTLVLTAIFDFRDDEYNEVGACWRGENIESLFNTPEIFTTIKKLIKDCDYALLVLSDFFKNSAQNKKVVATASVKFSGANEDWQLSFAIPNESEPNKYLRTLLYRLLLDRKRFLKEVKRVEDYCLT